MQLYLTSSKPWNASYCTKEGQAIYRVTRTYPRGEWHGPLLTIEKVIPPSKEDVENGELQDKFELLATYQHRNRDFSSGPITMHMDNSPPIKFRHYFKESNDDGRRCILHDHFITGPDGNYYKWHNQGAKETLFQVEGPNLIQVTKYQRAHSASLFRKEPVEPMLEIYDGWLHMQDWIFVTFALMENARELYGG